MENSSNKTAKSVAVDDPRRIKAIQFFDCTSYGTQIIKLDKTARAGGTTSLCSESIARRELFTLVCRTNENIIKAGIRDTQSVVGHPINVLHIARNSFCPKIQDLTTKYPALEKIGFIPLPSCDDCHIYECSIRSAYETPINQVDGFSLTYAKLQSLIIAGNKKAKQLIDRLLQSRNILLDEAHFLQESSTVSINVWQRKDGQETAFILDPQSYAKLSDSSPLFQDFLNKLTEIQVRIQPEIEALKKKSQENHYLKHLALSIQNPFFAVAEEKRKRTETEQRKQQERIESENPGNSWLDTAFMMQDYATTSETLKEIMRAPLSPSKIVKIQSLLITGIQNPQKYGLTEEQIVTLSKLLSITNANTLVLSYVKGAHNEQICLQAQDTLLYNSLRAFLSQASANSKNKRIIFTTATFGAIKLDKLLNLPNMKDYVWGDPLNTASKFLVVADKSRVSTWNFEEKFPKIKALVEAVISRYGKEENVEICCMNKRWAQRIGHGSTWYASDLTEGVASSKRIWIMIGLAEKPVNAKDNLAIIQAKYHDNPLNLQGDELLHYISQKLRVDSVHNATYQAISRAKDPSAKDRSIAIIVGATKDSVEGCLLWGPTRRLAPVKTERGLKFNVDIQEPIGKPNLTAAPLSSDVEESLHIIDQWLNQGTITKAGVNWANIKKIVDAKGYVSAKRLVTNHGMDLQEVTAFLSTLPDFLKKESLTDYVIVHDPQGAVKGIATVQYYGKQGKPSILYNTRSAQESIVLSDWFIAIKAAVEHAPESIVALNPSYFNKHVSANIYGHLSEFFDTVSANPNLCPGWIVVGVKSVRDNRKLLRDAYCFNCWAPDYPRRFGNPSQSWVNNHSELTGQIVNSWDKGLDSLISVNPFPDQKHPMEGGNPPISTIFIDIDVENEEFKELKSLWEKGDQAVIEKLLTLRLTAMADVLKQAKSVITYLQVQSIEPRILLSGFKGVHLFVDFPAVQFPSAEVAKQVTRKFLEQLAEHVTAETGIKAEFDSAVMGDVSRLCRIPNTPNRKASKLLGRTQFAVPLTVESFMQLSPADYDRLCSTRQYVAMMRKESPAIIPILSTIAEEGLFADDEPSSSVVTVRNSIKNPEKLAEYAKECTREILNAEDFESLNLRPCFKRVRAEKIDLTGGNGHKMRIGAVMELAAQNLSVDSIIRWFDFCSDFKPIVTENAVQDLIARGYTDKSTNEFGQKNQKRMKCATIRQCGYCLEKKCPIYRPLAGGEKNGV